MKNQLTNSILPEDIFSGITLKFDDFIRETENFLYNTDNLHILAVTLSALLVVSLFFAFLYAAIKLFSFFKRSDTKILPQETPVQAPEDDEKALETELLSELDSQHENQNDSDYKVKDRDTIKQEISLELNEESKEQKAKEDPLIALDWQKSRKKDIPEPQPVSLKKNIRDLICMIVNMLGRNVDELKISQALMFRHKEEWSEESVLQLVRSIKEFLNLCNQGAFNNIRRLRDLPSDEDCILYLIAGDPSYAMALMEALMDEKINQAVNLKVQPQRDAVFRQASDYACCFGTLAEINDPRLASASFELAVEMCPENTLAWSRCADIYKKTGQEDKANRAYRNVLKNARHGSDAQQEANAYKFLSQYLYDQGESVQASQLYMQSKHYYDSIGINRPLDRKEIEIISLIDSADTENIVNSVLYNKQNINNL